MALNATVYHVDLTRGTIDTKTLPEDVYRKYPGGSALAAYLLLQAMPAGAAPLGPDAGYYSRQGWRAKAGHRCAPLERGDSRCH